MMDIAEEDIQIPQDLMILPLRKQENKVIGIPKKQSELACLKSDFPIK